MPKSVEPNVDPTAELARCFLRLANLPNYALDRLIRYEDFFGAKPAKSCLRLTPWIAAKHRTEGAVSVLA